MALFFGLGLVGILHHEMWRDEMQAWMVARDAASFSQVLENLRYEGHPPLWHALLHAITRWTTRPWFMQLANLVIATGAIAVFVRHAPLARWVRWGFAFGYFPFYQYAVVSRCYALGMLLLFAFCALYARAGRRRYALLFALLLGLAQTSFTAASIAFALGLFLLWELVVAWPTAHRGARVDAAAGALVFAATLALVAIQVQQPPETWHDWAPEFHFALDWQRLAQTLGIVSQGYFFLSPLGATALPAAAWLDAAQTGVGAAAIATFALAFASRPRVLVLYLLATAGLLAIAYVKYAEVWHMGHLLLVLVTCRWLRASADRVEPATAWLRRWAARAERLLPLATAIVLAPHLASSAVATGWDWARPYSGSRAAAEAIRQAGLEDALLVGDHDAFASSIAGYLDRSLYYPRSGSFDTFVRWTRERDRPPLTGAALLDQVDALPREHGDVAVLVLTYPIDDSVAGRLAFLGRHPGHYETFYLYRYERAEADAAAAPQGLATPSSSTRSL